jgi:hypothetical protein
MSVRSDARTAAGGGRRGRALTEIERRDHGLPEDAGAVVEMIAEKGTLFETALPSGWDAERVRETLPALRAAGHEVSEGETERGVRYWRFEGLGQAQLASGR